MIAQAAMAQSPVNADGHGLAVKGYDVVAYFTMGKPVKGDSRYSYAWQGATWRFANARHLEAFQAVPAKYAPQYGGY
jgi:YHS domain-containing protein